MATPGASRHATKDTCAARRAGEKGDQGEKKTLQQFFEEKDRFVLLTVGTLVLFDPHDPDLEAAEGVKIPRVLWNQSRAQPPRYACGQHSDDVTQHVGDNVSLERSFYFALVNLLAHLCADRNTLPTPHCFHGIFQTRSSKLNWCSRKL